MTPQIPDPVQIAARVGALFDSLGLRYSVGGSLASSLSGEPRSTLDIDVVVAISEADVGRLLSALQGTFYVDEEALMRAVRTRSTANVIELATSIKVDLFVAGGTPLDDQLLQRRLRVMVRRARGDALRAHAGGYAVAEAAMVFVVAGRSRIVNGAMQGDRLDRAYLVDGASRLGVEDLLERAFPSSGETKPGLD